MAAMTQTKLKTILTESLKLRDPRFVLERYGPRLNGSVISQTFKGKDDLKRLDMIRDALTASLGRDYSRQVGLLLAYTPDEWDIDFEPARKPRHAKLG